MEWAVITNAKGVRQAYNPADRLGITRAVLDMTRNYGIAQDLAEWCDLASAGMRKTYDRPFVCAEIVLR